MTQICVRWMYNFEQPCETLPWVARNARNNIHQKHEMLVYCLVSSYIMSGSSSAEWKRFDPIKSIENLKRFFKLVGVWPLDIKNRFLYFLYIVYGILFQLTFSYAFAAFGSIVVETNVKMMTEQIFDGMAEIAMCVRMTNFLYHFKDATNFLITIKSFELRNQEECELYKKRLSVFVTLMNIMIYATALSVTLSTFAAFFDSEIRLAYPAWYPLDWRNDRTSYWIVRLYQFIGGFILAQTLVRLECYQIYCMICATAQIEILGTRLKEIGYDTQDKPTIVQGEKSIYELQLLDCVKQHKILIKFVSDMERVFAIPFLFQLICSVAIFCVTGYRMLLMEDDLVTLGFYLVFFLIFVNEIFLLCYFGTLLTVKHDALSEALYSSNWPDLPQSFKKTMMIFLEYLKRPKVMTSGKIFTITLSSFLTVVNRSYSMLAVLRTLMK